MSSGICTRCGTAPAAPSAVPPSRTAEQKVAVVCGGARACEVLRGQLLRVPDSYPELVFRDRSSFLGATVRWKGSSWVWEVHGVRAHDADAVREVIEVLLDPYWDRGTAGMSPGAELIARAWRLVS